MSADTPPRFDYLQRLPREIRDMIFGYMVQGALEYYEQERYPRFKSLGSPPDGFPPHGFAVWHVKRHLTTSPWAMLNKQYCIEYFKVVLREIEIHEEIPDPWADSPQICKESGQTLSIHSILETTLQLINHHSSIAAAHTGISASTEKLFPHIRGICFNYWYYASFFQRGFGKTDRRNPPTKNCFAKPVQVLRECHEEYDIPANKLSLDIWYGDPSWTILACLQQLDKLKHSIVSLRPLHARIFVDDYDTSVSVFDSELEVLRKSFGKIIEKMRIKYPKPHQVEHVLELEMMVERDMMRLRNEHLRIVTETTNFWKARDGGYDLGDMFRIAKSWGSESEGEWHKGQGT